MARLGRSVLECSATVRGTSCAYAQPNMKRQQSRRRYAASSFAFVPKTVAVAPRFPHAAFGRVIELGLVPVFTFVPCYPSAAAGTPSPTSIVARLRVHGCSFRATLMKDL